MVVIAAFGNGGDLSGESGRFANSQVYLFAGCVFYTIIYLYI